MERWRVRQRSLFESLPRNAELPEPQRQKAVLLLASAQLFHQVVMTDVIEAALNISLNDPIVWQVMPPSIRRASARENGSPDMLQSSVTASSATKPVRDTPELRFEDRLQKVLDRALYYAILDGRNAQWTELPRLAGLGNQLAPRRTRSICASAQLDP